MSNALHGRLTQLYDQRELSQLKKVSEAMLTDPTVFDTHSREVRHLQAPNQKEEKQDGKA